MKNLKKRLKQGETLHGCWLNTGSPLTAEIVGLAGFDWVLIDNEHGSITVDTAEAMITAAELTGVAPIVRPVANRMDVIAPFLDRGAWGVQVPHVNTREEAEAAVAACKYFPEGQRGSFSGGRPAQYGIGGTPSMDYFAKANAETLV